LKLEHGEQDYFFFFARDSLLRYAEWMLANEVPYKDVLHKVEIPTETWPAQDIRKCHALNLAARCSMGDRRVAYASRASFFFERAMADLTSFNTAYLARPRVILAVFGPVHWYFSSHGHGDETSSPYVREHGYDFGEPQVFVPQRADVMRSLIDRGRVTVRELKRLALEGLGRMQRK
jgi:hypothetical protein